MARRGRVDVRLGGIDVGRRLEAALEQLRQAVQVDPRLREPDFVLVRRPRAPLRLRFGQRQRRPHAGVVEARQHLAFLDGHAFLDVDLDDLARDLRRHRRLAPRGHVAGRVQDGRLCTGRPRVTAAVCTSMGARPSSHTHAAAPRRSSSDEHGHPDTNGAAAPFRCALDAKSGEVVLKVSHRPVCREGAAPHASAAVSVTRSVREDGPGNRRAAAAARRTERKVLEVKLRTQNSQLKTASGKWTAWNRARFGKSSVVSSRFRLPPTAPARPSTCGSGSRSSRCRTG